MEHRIFKEGHPGAVGIPAESIDAFVGRLHDMDIPLHSVLLLKDDTLVYEAYQEPFDRKSLHRMFSVTKSFVSLAIGLLCEEGKLKLDDYIVDYFPEKLPKEVHPYIKAMTIRNMLAMRTAHHKTTYKLEGCEDWVQSFFTVEPTHYPGTFFAYDTSSAHVLAALVEKLSGKELLDYLREKFLDDLGFSKEAYCLKDPMGVSMGGSGLMASSMDLMKVMYLLLKGGCLGGRQYLPKEYLDLALAGQSDNYAISASFEEMQGYGYQFWRTTHEGYVCYGMGGQLGLCLPKQNMILVTTADTQGRQGGVGLIYEAFWDTVYKACVENKAEIEAGAKDVRAEASLYRGSLKQVCLPQRGMPPIAQKICGRTIAADKNDKGFVSFRLEFGEDKGKVYYADGAGEHCLEFGLGHNIETAFPRYGHRALASGAWRNENTFLIYVQIIDEYVGKVFLNFSFNEEHVGILLKKIEETYYKEFDLITGGTIQGD